MLSGRGLIDRSQATCDTHAVVLRTIDSSDHAETRMISAILLWCNNNVIIIMYPVTRESYNINREVTCMHGWSACLEKKFFHLNFPNKWWLAKSITDFCKGGHNPNHPIALISLYCPMHGGVYLVNNGTNKSRSAASRQY